MQIPYYPLNTNRSPKFIGADKLWKELGGRESAGEGVIVGILDTGIWPEHPSFSDPDPLGNPYSPPPPKWTGTACEFGSAEPGDVPFTCNNKLIGAARFMATYDLAIGLIPTEFPSARDDDGHGTHTTSTAAGNAGAPASYAFGAPDIAVVSGVAPRAHVVMYRVCGVEGCFGSDSAAAVQQAILDGVDVINFSIGGGTNPYSSAASLAFLDAYEAGVFVAASAGNSGPGADTVAHREPWTTTVGASTTDRYFQGSLALFGDDTLSLVGTSTTGDVSAAVVMATDFDALADDDPEKGMCNTPFPAGTFSGEIVICKRGGIARVTKGENARAGGASGMVLFNTAAAQTLNHDKHYLPAVHIDAAAGVDLLDFMSSQTLTVMGTISQGISTNVKKHPGGPPPLSNGTAGGKDVMASFSSRGGPGQTLGISKPDVTAPGVAILAGGTPMPNDSGEASSFGELGLFMSIGGTSMSSPHVAGSAALLKDLHPDWTPWQIKSALMATATTKKVVKEDGVTPADPFDFGSGRINLKKAGDPGLTFLSPSKQDFLDLQSELWHLNYPSLYIPLHPGKITVERTVQSELSKKSEWQLKVKGPEDVKITVPKKLKISAGDLETFEIMVDARNVPIGEVRHVNLNLKSKKGGKHDLNFPITVVRQQAAVTLDKFCDPTTFPKGDTTDCTISLTNTSFSDETVSLTDILPKQLKLVKGSVVGATEDGNGLIFDGTLFGAEPPEITVDAGYAPYAYLPLSYIGAPPNVTHSDESIVNFDVPPFVYAGQTYTTIGMVSNGYAVVGGAIRTTSATSTKFFPIPTDRTTFWLRSGPISTPRRGATTTRTLSLQDPIVGLSWNGRIHPTGAMASSIPSKSGSV